MRRELSRHNGLRSSASYWAATCVRPTMADALTGAGQYVGLLEYYGYDLGRLNTYFTNADQTNHVPINRHIDRWHELKLRTRSACDDTEQMLDMTQALHGPGAVGPLRVRGFQRLGHFSAMSTHSPLPAQLSSSWTWSPADPSTDDPYFKEFAAQGQNLFQAAGDSGAWTATGTVRRFIRLTICM